MCDVCEGCLPMTPRIADVPAMDVEAEVERWCSLDGGRGTDLVVYRASGEDAEARFSIRYCPACGRRLVDR